ALKPAPGEVLLIEQIADVETGERDGVDGGRDAIVKSRARVTGDRAISDLRVRSANVAHDGHAVRLARNQIQSSWCGGTEGIAKAVIAHGKFLRVIPERGDGIAVIEAHDERLAITVVTRSRSDGDKFNELVHQAAVERFLLVGVVMILVAGDSFGAA